jgi:outer membrane protein OmpA-like peptidoglycan-associated protein
MSRFGKCQNLAGCLLAYRGEEIEVEKGQPFICAECGKPLVETKPPSTMWLRYLYGIIAVAVLGGGALVAFPQLRGVIEKHKHEKGETETKVANTSDQVRQPDANTNTNPTNSDSGPPSSTPSPATPSPSPDTATPDSEPTKEAPRAVFVAPPKIDLDASKGENKDVKNEVLTRIDLMPGISSGNKDKLYQSVERARSMGKVLTIPFGSGRTELSQAEIQTLKTELEKPDVASLRSDPTAVFVILGYADPKGDAKKNLVISQNRADAVLKAMKDKCGISNVLHSVAMGGSKLLDAQNLEKNRIVEIWAVLP